MAETPGASRLRAMAEGSDEMPRARHAHAGGGGGGGVNGHAPTPVPHAVDEDPLLLPPAPAAPVSILADGKHSLCGTALRAFALGGVLGGSALGVLGLLAVGSPLWRLPFFLFLLALFHFLEFYVTARYNTAAASTDAFLLTSNGTAYNVAHVLAMLETTLTHSLVPYPPWMMVIPATWQPALLVLGFALLLTGQLARSIAMAQAGTNFNHLVQSQKRRGHELVTTGIYAVLRHPSYFGFFWWAVGGQIVLGNALCLVAYVIVLWRFFSWRVRGEEKLLVRFFGDEYVQYQKRTYTGIPFVP